MSENIKVTVNGTTVIGGEESKGNLPIAVVITRVEDALFIGLDHENLSPVPPEMEEAALALLGGKTCAVVRLNAEETVLGKLAGFAAGTAATAKTYADSYMEYKRGKFASLIAPRVTTEVVTR